MDISCGVTQIRKQVSKLPVSRKTYDQLYRMETERAQITGRAFRKGVEKILVTLQKKIKRNSKANGGGGRTDPRSKVNGGGGRTDSRSKANGGGGRKDVRNIITGGEGRKGKTPCVCSKTTRMSQCETTTSACNELRDFWWHHSTDAAIIASCCASHEAAMHTFWSVEEWMVHIAAATTGLFPRLRSNTYACRKFR